MKRNRSISTLCQCFLFIALSLYAIEANAAPSLYETIELATSYIVEHQNPDGGWPLVPGQKSDVEITALATQALLAKGWGNGSKVIRTGVAYMRHSQRPDGSWNGNTAHTIFALLALTDAKTDSEARLKGLGWITEAQNEDGSWGQQMLQPGNPVYTGAVLAGLRRLHFQQNYPAASKAADWLADPNRINPDGGWSILRGQSSDLFVTSWVLQGLSLVYDIDAQIAWLKQAQNEDGGFGKRKGAVSDPEITAYAIMALAAGQDPLNADKIAIGYLREVQQEDGSFISATPIELKEPTANLQTTCFALLAIHARKIEGKLDK
jgi:prenyltransferase beta subunit